MGGNSVNLTVIRKNVRKLSFDSKSELKMTENFFLGEVKNIRKCTKNLHHGLFMTFLNPFSDILRMSHFSIIFVVSEQKKSRIFKHFLTFLRITNLNFICKSHQKKRSFQLED